MDSGPVGISSAPPETVLPEPPPPWSTELAEALVLPREDRMGRLAALAAAHPSYIDVWAALARNAAGTIESYAYARVGYHRGLDALRANGWHGSGYVRWQYPSNRGFLQALDALRAAAEAIGEDEEEQRCAFFLRQLDPSWTADGPPDV